MDWNNIWIFLQQNWFKMAFIVWLFYFAKGCGTGWIKEQIDWVKLLFVDDDELSIPNAPSHKNAVLLALTATFMIAFLKKVALSESSDVPDIPQVWAMVLLTGLGIMAAKTAGQKLFENKWNNGNGNGNGGTKPPTP